APGGPREAAAERALRRICPDAPRVAVGASAKLGIPVDLDVPDRTGADRYADAVAAAHRFGTPCIACDFGTATTFNLVLPKRGFCGGAIAPGYGMWFRALGAGAARLPGLDPAAPAPIRAKTGRNPEQAIRLGARWGFRGMVTEILWQLSKTCGKTSPVLVATGGWAPLVLEHAGFAMAHVPELTLEGIALVALRTLS
ncbi:MAG: type III pantothenate kinase, partial [Kiritimatiellae bacterium]|nr:type III pantothenate kinase [Kiritimatiellia bacterium]